MRFKDWFEWKWTLFKKRLKLWIADWLKAINGV